MLNTEEIQEYVKGQNVPFDLKVRLRPSDETIMLYVPQIRVGQKVENGLTSIRQLNNLKKHLFEKYAKPVEIILIQEESQQDLESGFFQILNRKHQDRIVSLYTSFRDGAVVDAFIEVSELGETLQQDIAANFENILKDAAFQLGSLQWLNSPSELPTLIVLLRSLKKLQPINLSNLTVEMQASYKSVTERWINHKLDQLRKKGLILRQHNELYVLTDNALRAIPATNRRTSSDIDRALALGRRRW